MSNLLIAYPHIQYQAVGTATNATWDSDFGYRNTIGGERYAIAQTTSTSAFNIEYELGTAAGVAVTSICDYLILARADKLIASSTTAIGLSTGAAGLGGAYSSVWSDGSFAAATLYGPKSKDYIQTGLALAAARCWRFDTTVTGTPTQALSKIYFGVAFDIDINPDYEIERIPAKDSLFYFSSGASTLWRIDDPIYRVDLTWDGVTDEKVEQFQNTVVKQANVYGHKVFLYTANNHAILDDVRVLHARLVSSSVRKNSRCSDWHTVTASFEEVLG